MEQDAVTGQQSPDCVLPSSMPEPEGAKIVPGPGSRNPALALQHPPRKPARTRTQSPLLSSRQVNKMECRRGRTLKGIQRPDLFDVLAGCGVAGEQQVIAVIDSDAQLGIKKRAAA